MTPHRFKIISVAAALVPFFHHAVGREITSLQKITPLEIGAHHVINISPSDLDSETHTYKLQHEDASYLSVHLKSVNFPSGCYLETTDVNGKQSHKFTDDNQLGFAHTVRGDTMLLKLHCDTDVDNNAFVIDKYAAGYSKLGAGTETLCDEDTRGKAKCYLHQEEYEMSKSVARVLMEGNRVCTGWLIKSKGQNLAITNNHCIDSDATASKSFFHFNYEHTGCHDDKIETYVSFKVVELVHTDESILVDMSLVRLEGQPGALFGELEPAEYELAVSERIYIPQHPLGNPKVIAIDDEDNTKCSLYRYDGWGSMRYTCDTEGGSSGSPVLDGNNKVVGLHKWSGTCDKGNGATPMSDFLDQIRDFIIIGGGVKCQSNEYEENGKCKPCFIPNCTTKQCSGPGKGERECTECKNGYTITDNSQGGTWCKLNGGGGKCRANQYKNKNGKCKKCFTPNCKIKRCTGPGKGERGCKKCRNGYTITPNSEGGTWCKRNS